MHWFFFLGFLRSFTGFFIECGGRYRVAPALYESKFLRCYFILLFAKHRVDSSRPSAEASHVAGSHGVGGEGSGQQLSRVAAEPIDTPHVRVWPRPLRSPFRREEPVASRSRPQLVHTSPHPPPPPPTPTQPSRKADIIEV